MSDLDQRALAEDPEQLEAWLGVAAQLCLCGNAAAAAQRLAEILENHPDSVPLRATLGDLHHELGQHCSALACYERVLDDHPEHLGCRLGLALCLSRRPELALRLRSRRHLLESLTHEHVDPELLAQSACVLLRASPSLLDDGLLHTLLLEAVLADPTLERELTGARRALCLSPPGEAPELALALAGQCRLNESAWAVSPEEEEGLLSAPDWVRAMYDPGKVAPMLVERGGHIPSLTAVSAGTSDAVRAQYEANPYPRWRRVSRPLPVGLDQHLRLLTGGEWKPPEFLRRPRLLAAGCGTGGELLGAACAWRPSTVTGFDLSRTSLACAQQSAGRLGVAVELYHADLLRLDRWDRRFDALLCTGVLHHLDDPLQGWRTLVRLLRPGGVMLVGLYSEIARRGVAAAQAEVRQLRLPPTPEGIRLARRRVAELPHGDPARDCTLLRDFYSLSGCRDMLFHVQEHRFTVPRIAAALHTLGLELVAFETDGSTRNLFRTLFGSTAGADLACWDKLEELYPRTFLGMYQFWCQKRGGAHESA